MLWNFRARHFCLEPVAYIAVESNAMHVIVERRSQRGPQGVMVNAGCILKVNIVVGEGHLLRRVERHAVLLRVLADWRVHRASKAMKETRLNAAIREELSDVFERVDGV